MRDRMGLIVKVAMTTVIAASISTMLVAVAVINGGSQSMLGVLIGSLMAAFSFAAIRGKNDLSGDVLGRFYLHATGFIIALVMSVVVVQLYGPALAVADPVLLTYFVGHQAQVFVATGMSMASGLLMFIIGYIVARRYASHRAM